MNIKEVSPLFCVCLLSMLHVFWLTLCHTVQVHPVSSSFSFLVKQMDSPSQMRFPVFSQKIGRALMPTVNMLPQQAAS